MDPQQRKHRAAALSVVSNTILVGGKLAVGLAIGSVSVISEAIHSAVDLLAAIIAWVSVRISGKPADADHQFGHGKVENVSGTIEAILILVAAVWIIVEAVHKLLRPAPVEHAGLGAVIMAISALANWLVSHHLFTVGRQTDSVALLADAWHLRTDVLTSLGVMVAMAVLFAGSRFWPLADLHWVDPVAAILVALLILQAAWKLTVSAARDLFDSGLPPDEQERIRAAIASAHPEIRSVISLRTRKAGPDRYVEVVISLPPSMPVDCAHAITEAVEQAVGQAIPHTQVTVHVEPG